MRVVRLLTGPYGNSSRCTYGADGGECRSKRRDSTDLGANIGHLLQRDAAREADMIVRVAQRKWQEAVGEVASNGVLRLLYSYVMYSAPRRMTTHGILCRFCGRVAGAELPMGW